MAERKEITILEAGIHTDLASGRQYEITEAELDEIIANAAIGGPISMREDPAHRAKRDPDNASLAEREQRARIVPESLRRVGRKLLAVVEAVNERGADILRDSLYPAVSMELAPFKRGDEAMGLGLTSGVFTDRPVIKAALLASSRAKLKGDPAYFSEAVDLGNAPEADSAETLEPIMDPKILESLNLAEGASPDDAVAALAELRAKAEAADALTAELAEAKAEAETAAKATATTEERLAAVEDRLATAQAEAFLGELVSAFRLTPAQASNAGTIEQAKTEPGRAWLSEMFADPIATGGQPEGTARTPKDEGIDFAEASARIAAMLGEGKGIDQIRQERPDLYTTWQIGQG